MADPVGVGGIYLDTRRLDEIARKLNTNANTALKTLAARGAQLARMNIYNKHIIDTGALWNSIDFEKKSELTYWVFDQVEYGIYHEFGTHKMAARPWMIPALESVAKDFGLTFKRELFK